MDDNLNAWTDNLPDQTSAFGRLALLYISDIIGKDNTLGMLLVDRVIVFKSIERQWALYSALKINMTSVIQ